MVLKDPRFKSCERINTINFSLLLKIKSLDMLLFPIPVIEYDWVGATELIIKLKPKVRR